MEIATMVLSIITAIVFVTCILYWYRIGYRLSKLIAKLEKDIEPDKIDRSQLDESENVFEEEWMTEAKKWLDEHMD